MKNLLIVFCAFLISACKVQNTTTATYFEQYTIQGTVYDDKTKEPLIGSSVLIKNTTYGTVTDINGAFKLSIPDNLATDSITFQVQFVFYYTAEFTVSKEELSIPQKIYLTQSATIIKETEVTHVNIKKKNKSQKQIKRKLK